jgi:hypothetical protein
MLVPCNADIGAMKIIYFISILFTGAASHAAASHSATSSADVEIVVLQDLISWRGAEEGVYGVNLPRKELKELQILLGKSYKLIPIGEFINEHSKKHDEDYLITRSFVIRVAELDSTEAIVYGGNYPVPIQTKRGPMYEGTDDFEYKLSKKTGQWKVVSKTLIGES